METFADKIISFNYLLEFNGDLPKDIGIMNPFRENPSIMSTSSAFYKKYYNDNYTRHMILGINPGRFGAGLTGIPFTDPKRLISNCGIDYVGNLAHEPSSVYVYEVINEFGGEEEFYRKFYINSVCPLGFTSGKKGKEVNYNYYDSKELTDSVFTFILESIKNQIAFGINTEICYCLGTGKNEKFLIDINNQFGFFKKIIGLEHPRYIMQYKSKNKETYISKYLNAFSLAK
ncbi:uracil-DNA glycosylase family protein [Cognataquiflexum aquatile]|uniref:uracil-DNA glycosylase family protein n=1 Tax=Cognataquiflexum aquatile TaxID=2249427 RepID=UPI000DE94D96|nr:uracil-DNA glycosylase family protein [Cognataquiflexum aquatile]